MPIMAKAATRGSTGRNRPALHRRGASSLLGYYNAPQQTRETLTSDGFVRTSDLVKAHVHDGVTYYSFEDRLKDNIHRGGEKQKAPGVKGLGA